jgi:hypothetical protein
MYFHNYHISLLFYILWNNLHYLHYLHFCLFEQGGVSPEAWRTGSDRG